MNIITERKIRKKNKKRLKDTIICTCCSRFFSGCRKQKRSKLAPLTEETRRMIKYEMHQNIPLSAFYFFQVDVYSFGLLLLEMCIREYPVPDQISHQIQYVSDPRLQELIRRCVKQDPERRLIMDEVIQILTRLRE